METFVVRIWAPADPAERSSATALQGRVEHVASGRGVAFRGAAELCRLLLDQVRRTATVAGVSAQKKES